MIPCEAFIYYFVKQKKKVDKMFYFVTIIVLVFIS